MPLKPGNKKPVKGVDNDVFIPAPTRKFQKKIEELERQLRTLKAFKPTKREAEAYKDALKRITTELKVAQAKIKEVNAQNTDAAKKKFTPLVKSLAKDCSDAIGIYQRTNAVLFRGAKGNPVAYIGRPRTDRRPKDSLRHGQNFFDYCLQKLGFTALRSNSIFATYDLAQASSYGTVYVVFPKNGFKFTQTNEGDLILNDRQVIQLLDYTKLNKLNDAIEKYIVAMGGDFMPNLEDYLDNPDEYFDLLRDMEVPGSENLTIEHFISVKAFQKTYNPQQTDFARAVSSGHEVLINGEYYAVRHDIGMAILPLLGINFNDYQEDY